MIRVVLVEDELPARNKIKRFLNDLGDSIEIIEECDSVEFALAFFEKNPKVDLLISDIELLDGNAFQIFQEVKLSCPIIFTTAYNQFWMQAFESNGIEYLLKPFDFARFQKAWNKFKLLAKSNDFQAEAILRLAQLLEEKVEAKPVHKSRWIIPNAKGSYLLASEEISYFSAENGVVWAHDQVGKRHLLQEATLKEVENQLDEAQFFRISRSHLVHQKYVEGMERYSKNAVSVKMKGTEKLLMCSQSATPAFMKWITTA
ncbi:MAG: LytTR family DNA-binding domain-containing protein [Algoriphagus sp.]|uniref:LytR/AlgR family response regulator transcription factor n=1 Tax=Algoriphagus sp. TaxID=1872435 RepID=UPI003294F269